MVLTNTKKFWRVGNQIFTLDDTQEFSASGDVAFNINPDPVAPKLAKLKYKNCYKLKQISFWFKNSGTTKPFQLLLIVYIGGTNRQAVKIYENLTFTGQEIMLFDGIDFSNIFYNHYQDEPDNSSSSNNILQGIIVILKQATVTNPEVQVITEWEDLS